MASMVKIVLVRLVCYCVYLADFIGSLFGKKIFEMNMQSLLRGLTPAEIAEAKHPDIIKPLGLVVDGFEKDSQLDAMGRVFQMNMLKNILKRRVAISQALKDHPDVLKTPVRKPIFIIGPPRTGTTMLQNVLAQDPQFASPMLWELLNPTPPGRQENWRESQRYKEVAKVMEFSTILSGKGFDLAHELRADGLSECLIAMGRNFLQYYYHIRFTSFSAVEEWYYSQTNDDLVKSYQHYRQTLQLMTYKSLEEKTLLLKAHMHLIGLEALLTVFPDARLIFTCRPMAEVMASFCSMSTKAMNTMLWGKRDEQFGKRCLRQLSVWVNRAAETMKKYDHLPQEQNPFYCVDYGDMVKDPLNAVKGIYDRFGLVLTEEAKERMGEWLVQNPQHKHGRHTYSLGDYRLTNAGVASEMRPYLDYFKDHSLE